MNLPDDGPKVVGFVVGLGTRLSTSSIPGGRETFARRVSDTFIRRPEHGLHAACALARLELIARRVVRGRWRVGAALMTPKAQCLCELVALVAACGRAPRGPEPGDVPLAPSDGGGRTAFLSIQLGVGVRPCLCPWPSD
jgi:hypothetical protein